MRLRIAALLSCLSCLGYCPLSVASLGGNFDSVVADQQIFMAQSHSTLREAYQMHELTAPSGTIVREYADASGKIFAVTWKGPIRPSLSQLLGASFARFKEAAQQSHSGHHALLIHDPDLVIESIGRMRAFSGRAVLPQAVPAGVDVGALE